MLNLEAIKLLLTSGANICDLFDNNGDNALKISEKLGIGKIFHYLANCDELSPLVQATLARDLESLKFFIRCSYFLVLESESRGENCLIQFLNSIRENNKGVSEIELSITKELVNGGIQVQKKCDNFGFLISIASDIGNYKMIQLLCQIGSDVPYDVASNAITRGRHDLLSLYINHGNILQYTGTLLDLSLELEQTECAALFLQHGAELELPKSLEIALLNWKSETLSFVIKHCDVHSLRHHRGDLLHIAVEKGDIELVKCLLDSGWDVNCVHNGKSPMMLALSNEMITLLLDRKADVNFKTDTTILLNALTFLYMSKIKLNKEAGVDYLGEIIHTLLSHNADVNNTDYDGQTPIMAAASLHGCNKILEQLLAAESLINSQDQDGRTALHHAILNGNFEGLGALLKNKANVHIKDRFGATPLNRASTMRCSSQILSCLLQYDSDVNIEDNEGNTAMLNLARYKDCDVDLVKLLIEHGAEVNHKNKNGQTALFYAMQNLHVQLFQLLLDSGADAKTLTSGDKNQKNPLTLLLHNSFPTNSMFAIAELLCNHGIYEATHLHPSVVHRLIASNRWPLLHKLICKGLAPKDIKCRASFLSWPEYKGSPLGIALMLDKVKLVKYFIKICFLTDSDLDVLSGNAEVLNYLTTNNKLKCLQFINKLSRRPPTLTTLSLLKVSSCIGWHEGRLERLEAIQLPWPLNKNMSFKSNGAITDDDIDDTDCEILKELILSEPFNN